MTIPGNPCFWGELKLAVLQVILSVGPVFEGLQALSDLREGRWIPQRATLFSRMAEGIFEALDRLHIERELVPFCLILQRPVELQWDAFMGNRRGFYITSIMDAVLM